MNLLKKIINEVAENLPFFSIQKDIHMDQYKKFTELSVLAEYCNLGHGITRGGELEKINRFIFDELNTLSADTIFQNFYLPYHLVSPYLSIREQMKIDKYEKYIDIITDFGFFSPEALPHREMEWSFFKYKLGLQAEVVIPDSCILNKNIYLSHLDRELTYSITHALFYKLDFGFMEGKQNIRDVEGMRFMIENLIIKSYLENDIDILLELCINYFSLSGYTGLNPEIVLIAQDCLIKNDFIRFGWDEKGITQQVYHSFLVLGILCCLIEKLINVNDAFSLKLKGIYEKSIFYSEENEQLHQDPEFDIRAFREYKAWQVILDFEDKNIRLDNYLNYRNDEGTDPFLDSYLVKMLDIFLKRNQKDILWEREFGYLNIGQENKELLKQQYKQHILEALNTISGNKETAMLH
ncbi:hypothetical protein AAEO56_17660 [Flavobacterium sp. DGU11]|uniref:DUF6895 domain-containing protein n=1 Tax=Flavobacterium arundinis TaxID=3139143 RepID=A0ABU9I109_9FLAO